VVDASNAARSVAAVVKGFAEFDPRVRLLGVILNRAAGPAHLEMLREAIAPVGVPVLGSFPRMAEVMLEERHLGLVTAAEKTWNPEQVARLAAAAEKYVDLERVLAGAEISPPVDKSPAGAPLASLQRQEKVRIGIARDRAFSFYYQSSLDTLREAGAELVEVSPLDDCCLPAALDGLYFGGGYPEVFAEALAQNRPFLESLREFVSSGRPVYAECGGLMYLAEELITLDGRRHVMASVMPLAIEMLTRLDGFGYTDVEVLEDCLVGARGARLRGHSFHYSRVTRAGALKRQYHTHRSLGGSEDREGFCVGNVLASYIHLNFAASPDAAANFIRHCRQTQAVA
jgi:cobyrinic acid a,c-diamide synthase